MRSEASPRDISSGADITRMSGSSTSANLSWMRALIADAAENFRLPGLTPRQTLTLKKRVIQSLVFRSGYWLLILLIGNALTQIFGQTTPIPGRTDPGLLPEVPMTLWSISFWVLSLIPYVALLIRAIRLPEDAHACLRLHLLTCIWIAAVSICWYAGIWTVLSVKFVPGSPPQFILGRQTFLILTLNAAIIPLVLMTPSLFARTIVLLTTMGCLFLAWWSKIFPFSIFLYWNAAQIAVCYGLSALLASDELRFHKRAILALEALAKVGTFVRSLSHDIPQPVSAISNDLEIMRETVQDPGILRYVRRIQAQIDALNMMTSGTFDLARLVAGTWEIRVTEVSLPELFGVLKREVEGRREITFDVAPYIVRTDATALYRILMNLISNALRYTPADSEKGPGRVAVSCQVLDAKGVVRVSVEDNGIGMPNDKLEDVFKEFVQLSNPERNRAKGLGLGLSIVKGLCETLKHPLGVESRLGEGSRFWVDVTYLSRIPEAIVSAGAEPESEPKVDTLSGMFVILVEDDQDQLRSLTELLEVWGCTVLSGESSDAAMSLIRSREYPEVPDFIIADYNLGAETGLDAISKISAGIGAEVPAVVLTGSSDPVVLRRLAASGLVHIHKSDKRELLRRDHISELWNVLQRCRDAAVA